jgi:pSer/pThr/pTyr-binding forkhead associated (FHA) protein
MPQLKIFFPTNSPITFDVTEERATIGRFAQNGLQIDEPSVSGHHADILLKGGRYHLYDAGSTNGTFVNDEQITDAILRSGDQVRFGTVEGVFISEEESTLSQSRPDFLTTSFEAATSSVRPENFVSFSPTSKNVKRGDPFAVVPYGLAALALLAFGAAVLFMFTM